MLLLAIALAVGAWWWLTREMPRREHERAVAEQAARARVERAASLYRWRDAQGNLHVDQDPPNGVKYERVGRAPADGIEIDGRK